MPRYIEHIDAIARKTGRGVLYLEFHPRPFKEWRNYQYEADATRTAVLSWFDEHEVPWTECGPFANPNQMVPYLGQVYIDIPYDDTVPDYRRVCSYLEHPDGSIRHAGVRFYVMSLDHAMENAAHDEPGFWERWAEDF
jgi:hypothetical protein